MQAKSRKPKVIKTVRFAGVSLAGGKTDKTAVAVVEYFPAHQKIFLRSLRVRLGGEGEISADLQLHNILTKEETKLNCVAFDVPIMMPKCVRCQLKCPGYEKCKQPEIKWLWKFYRKKNEVKRPHRLFTPYTERCTELYISSELEEPFYPSHALGANAAPLTARGHFITRRLKTPAIEVHPKLSLWRIGRSANIPKSFLRYHRHAMDSEEIRLYILKTLIDKGVAFIYQQDLREMVEDDHAFEAFFCALTAYLKYRGQCQKPPSDFPKGEPWIEFPVNEIRWF